MKTPTYHPASNGLVERAVQTFKNGMKKLREGSVETKMSRFLFTYRLTPQSSTGISPSELMFGRRLDSQLDNIQPNLESKTNLNLECQKKTHDSHVRYHEFNVGDLVYIKNYGIGNSWLAGTVTRKLGSTMYAVLLGDGRNVRKHSDQMRSRTKEQGSVEMNLNDSIDMRVPRAIERNNLNDETAESNGGESTSTQNVTSQEQELDTSNNGEPSPDPLAQLRRSSRVRNQTDYYGVVLFDVSYLFRCGFIFFDVQGIILKL